MNADAALRTASAGLLRIFAKSDGYFRAAVRHPFPPSSNSRHTPSWWDGFCHQGNEESVHHHQESLEIVSGSARRHPHQPFVFFVVCLLSHDCTSCTMGEACTRHRHRHGSGTWVRHSAQSQRHLLYSLCTLFLVFDLSCCASQFTHKKKENGASSILLIDFRQGRQLLSPKKREREDQGKAESARSAVMPTGTHVASLSLPVVQTFPLTSQHTKCVRHHKLHAQSAQVQKHRQRSQSMIHLSLENLSRRLYLESSTTTKRKAMKIDQKQKKVRIRCSRCRNCILVDASISKAAHHHPSFPSSYRCVKSENVNNGRCGTTSRVHPPKDSAII